MYQYKLRPEYGNEALLLEFTKGPEQETFLPDLFQAFTALNLNITSATDVWINDEIVLDISSDAGLFVLTKDIWNIVFILTTDNQEGINILDQYLQQSDKFEKREADFSQYK